MAHKADWPRDHDRDSAELWLTIDELVDVIDDAVSALTELPSEMGKAERRAAVRRKLMAGRDVDEDQDHEHEEHAAAGKPAKTPPEAVARPARPPRAERRAERARRRGWYVE